MRVLKMQTKKKNSQRGFSTGHLLRGEAAAVLPCPLYLHKSHFLSITSLCSAKYALKPAAVPMRKMALEADWP